MSCPGQVWDNEVELSGNRVLTAGFAPLQVLASAEGRYTHCAAFFAWDTTGDTTGRANWDGVRLSLWARSNGVWGRLQDFTIGAAGMTSYANAAAVVYARSGLVLSAANVLCDEFAVQGESPSPVAAFVKGQLSIEVWSVT
jgi:hypothetical protein